MTADAVRELVEREIAGHWSFSNDHGCDLRRCLMSPELREYDDRRAGRPLVDPAPTVRLWLVLEELREDRRGYKIVYDESAGLFGLAVSGTARDVFIGCYGSFLETLRGM
jgi:hypothetical protein